MVAAIVLVALGMKSTLAHVGDPPSWPTATALAGGASLYLFAHVVFKLRTVGSLSVPRLIAALVLLAVIPLAHGIEAWVTVAIVAIVLWATIMFEALQRRDPRDFPPGRGGLSGGASHRRSAPLGCRRGRPADGAHLTAGVCGSVTSARRRRSL